MSTTGMTASTVAQTFCYSDQPLSMLSKRSHDSMEPLGISVEHDITIDTI